MDKQEAIQEILDDLEKQESAGNRTFRAYLHQPELIRISSNDAIQVSPPYSPNYANSFFNFTVNLPRPALDVKTIQLLKAVIPQAQCSIPDYSLIFPYYKLRTIPIDDIGTLHFVDKPSLERLYCVRLLPSWYKREYFERENVNYEQYGFNRTFEDYEDLLVELKKCCLTDPSLIDFIADDITFDYNRKENRFKFIAKNISVENAYPNWDSGTTYVKDDVVELADITYICKVASSINQSPDSNPSIWLNSTQYFADYPNFNTYLIAGFADPNVQTLLQQIQQQLDTSYSSVDFDFITSIPGNPYVKNQTLARRLGFTWDGTGLLTDDINDITSEGALIGGTIALFYNRFRSIPQYEIYQQDLGALEDPLTDTINTYTADGYCDLVYSNIISIYTSIIGTSSVDTTRDANLLGMIEMNCGNLGIAMVNNTIDTKLTKIQPDIYSIYIELRDENGQPYQLTNNSSVSLLLKLSYD